ncbi:DMSO/TMAO reductase YedYZ, molybdopterin-dependent catalytic subunit [Amycolatopsis xylanica]|uniref:DMSO/TMAO reductase YedYZ, molybdopterin-dependent catalytic subunit n=1 Tax=Amycolatopsis xylanica TaxID=589385 RepID=A0A1H3EUZ5_9PSEU|nr:molybdopterin-dependent oxidoreductase [Amycolatopsis xylanica]SDX82455.1 DMSO/TMAO reductase YedYZ, molybdopterin-dependent catalytic subunit [Amycolatopsis xylanica]
MKLPKFTSAAHSERVTSRIGLALAVTFTTCFLTGLISHLIQHPPGWFGWPSRPAGLYRVTQGLHVISGIASIPLLLAKLWSVFPKLFERPLIKSLPHALERGSILVLSASAFFELTTGLLNIAQNYPWNFYFPQIHYAIAWIAIGSILVHVAVKIPILRRALTKDEPEPATGPGLSRRGFLRTTWLAAGVSVVATAGATVPLLRGVSPLKWRSDEGSQGVPVNRTAAGAGITPVTPDWRLQVVTPSGTRGFSLDELRALPQTTAELPIACVEGWSRSAVWTGVSFPDLLRAAGGKPGMQVVVTSMEKSGIYATSVLPGEHTADDITLLALRLNGEVLDLDHGYPCRVIAPNRPGVLQTKWVAKLEAA